MSDSKPKFKLDALIAEDLRATAKTNGKKKKSPNGSALGFPNGKPPRELVERIIERVERI